MTIANNDVLQFLIDKGAFASSMGDHELMDEEERHERKCDERYTAAIEPIARGVSALIAASSGKFLLHDITVTRLPSLEVLPPGRPWRSLLVRTDNSVGACGGFDLSAVILRAYSLYGGFITLVFRTNEMGGRALVTLSTRGIQAVETYNPIFEPSDTLEIVLGVKGFNVGGRNYVRVPDLFTDPRGEVAFIEWVEALPGLLEARVAQLNATATK